MKHTHFSAKAAIAATASLIVGGSLLSAADWPQWGRTPESNMVSPEKNLNLDIDAGSFKGFTEEVDMTTTKGVRWVAKLGSQAYGNPTVANGRVYVGTNNESPRDSNVVDDRGIVMVFDEKTGELLWQLNIPKLGAGKVSDWEFIGVCSSPQIVGDKVFVTTNRCEIVCLDANGLKDGNAGPFTDEEKYKGAPVNANIDADIIWTFDMRDELGVFPHNVTAGSPLVIDGKVFATTSNGVDWSHTNIPSPLAPSLAVVDAKTGELVGEEASGVSQRALHASWSSPSFASVDGKPMVIWGGSDGWLYGFNPEPVLGEDDFYVLKEYFRYDCNKPSYRIDPVSGKPRQYATPPGPSEVIPTPVYHDGLVYVGIGQDPEHGDGVGRLSCVDPRKIGDISGQAEWVYEKMGRSMSTPSVHDGLIFMAEYAGKIHCLDAKTGELHWVHDSHSRIWGSTLVADGKVFIGNEDGDLIILEASKTKKIVKTVTFEAPIYSSPIIANGTIYVATQSHLYAFGK